MKSHVKLGEGVVVVRLEFVSDVVAVQCMGGDEPAREASGYLEALRPSCGYSPCYVGLRPSALPYASPRLLVTGTGNAYRSSETVKAGVSFAQGHHAYSTTPYWALWGWNYPPLE